jgi:hypothetical protein
MQYLFFLRRVCSGNTCVYMYRSWAGIADIPVAVRFCLYCCKFPKSSGIEFPKVLFWLFLVFTSGQKEQQAERDVVGENSAHGCQTCGCTWFFRQNCHTFTLSHSAASTGKALQCTPPRAFTAFLLPGIWECWRLLWPVPLVNKFWAFVCRLLPNCAYFPFNLACAGPLHGGRINTTCC